MKFRTAYSEQVRFYSPSGDKWKKCYKRKYGENGEMLLEEVPPENLYEKIQACRNGLLPADLVNRFNRGDSTAIKPDINSYRDLTNCPTDLAGALDHVQRTKELYQSLPKSIRSHYENNIDNLVKAIDDGSFFSTFSSNSVEKIKSQKIDSESLSADDIAKLKSFINEGGNK